MILLATPTQLFDIANLFAITGWLALSISLFIKPFRNRFQIYSGLWVPFGMGVIYATLFYLAKDTDIHGGFSSLQDVRALFSNDHLLLAGWVHYLAFDLFVGTWIAKDSQEKLLNPLMILPLLGLTFMFGPIGLLVYLLLRRFFNPKPKA
jgi:hypothetical protein